MKNRLLSLIAAMVLVLSTCVANHLALQASGIRVETDRTWYLAGEAMKVCVTADDAMIAYAELCDASGLAAGVVLSLKGGEGTGILELPANLHSGYYVLSVYTRHDAEVSQQLVAVINPLRKSYNDDIEWVRITDSDSLSYSLTSHLSPLFKKIPSLGLSVRQKAISSRRVSRTSMMARHSRAARFAHP